MNIENEIFKKSIVNLNKLENYGFKKENNNYVLEKTFLDNEFKAIITIDNKKKITGKVIDLQVEEEYLGLRTEMTGEFVTKVKEAYKTILIDIRNNCFDSQYFIFEQSNRINTYIKDKYNTDPEFLWSKFPGYGVYRNKTNNKWYAIIMNLDLSKLTDKSGEVEIMNLKLDSKKIESLLKKEGYYKAYHMGKSDWISVVLNDTLTDEEIISLLDESYNLINESTEWLVPANPKYYDVVNCFNNTDEIIWKQSSNIHINDIVYLYVAAPYSKIMFKCKVISNDIPFDYSDKNVSMRQIMKLKLLKKLDNKNYNFEYLNSLGIKAVRGPRKISKDISNKLK